MKWEKIFASYTSDRRVIYNLHKEFRKANSRKSSWSINGLIK